MALFAIVLAVSIIQVNGMLADLGRLEFWLTWLDSPWTSAFAAVVGMALLGGSMLKIQPP